MIFPEDNGTEPKQRTMYCMCVYDGGKHILLKIIGVRGGLQGHAYHR